VLVVDVQQLPMAMNTAAATMLGVASLSARVLTAILDQNPWLGHMIESCVKNSQSVGDPDASLSIGPREVKVRAEISPLYAAEGDLKGAIILLHDLARERSAEQAMDGDEPVLRLSPAGLAHEIKNPLTGIKGAAELLAAMFPGEPKAARYSELILAGVNRITALVEQVLSVSSPQRLSREPLNIHQVLHSALAMNGLFPVPPAGMTVEQELDPSLPLVRGDEIALERAFVNLIRNAQEAMENRGTIRIRTRMETEFRMTAEGKRVQFLRVEIIDSGLGMPEAQLEQLFTPFFTTKPHGSGLGLVLSQRIFALHGGKLWAERGGVRPKGERELAADRLPGMTFKAMLPVDIAE